MTKINLLGFTRDEFTNFFLKLGAKSFQATQIIKWIHQLGVIDFAHMTNFKVLLRQYLTEHCVIGLPVVTKELEAADGTKKWVLQLEDNNFIETVFIPDGTRGTLCVSSQVGCSLGCVFCATGKLGFTRNLTVAEIIGQLWLAVWKLLHRQIVTNVVFMGMGEPLLNYDNVLKAVELMLDDNAYGLSKYRVTLSTCGLIPEILRLRQQSPVALAISLHAPTDALRNKLMPINKKYPLKDLMFACNNYYMQEKRRRVTVEYIMLHDVNDSDERAKQLVTLLSYGRYKVNLIPGNIVDNSYRSSSEARIDAFRNILLSKGINTITRKSRGSEIMAACGQLGATSGIFD